MAIIKRFIKRLIANSLVWRLLVCRRKRNQVAILMYHKVVADVPGATELTVRHFNAHLDWLQRNYDILTPEQFIALDRSSPMTGKPKALLTFDDAFISIKEYVYPILKSRQLRGLVFVPSEPVIERDTIWPQKVSDIFLFGRYKALPAFDGNGTELRPESFQQRVEAESEVRKRLKTFPNHERHAALAELEAAAAWDSSQLQHNSRIMSWDELRACADVFTYGGHTHTHPVMATQSKADQGVDVSTCVEHLRSELSLEPSMFAYPNGQPGDYNQDSLDILAEAGYRWAFTTEEGVYRLQDDPMTIRRLPTWAPSSGDLAWLILTAA
tara:strand:+ start:79177 stop:80154 length:978 start_codon:yes stop_codon:yes gene_type:complete